MAFVFESNDYPDTISECINAMCSHMSTEVNLYATRTIRHYRDGCRAVLNILQSEYPDALPQIVVREQIQWLLSYLKDNDYAISTSKGYIQCLRKICDYYHNDVFSSLDIRYPHDMRPTVDWLTLDQAKQLLSVSKTPTQEIMVHLELCLGLRRVECARIKLRHIHSGYIDIMGKGSMGGKPRTVPNHADTDSVLQYYLEYRREVAKTYVKRKGYVNMPQELMITKQCQPFDTDRCTGLDYHMNKLAEKVDFHFSNHTLRRTFGRSMYKAGVDLLAISKFLGHEDHKTTIEYLGLNYDDMYDAIQMSPF